MHISLEFAGGSFHHHIWECHEKDREIRIQRSSFSTALDNELEISFLFLFFLPLTRSLSLSSFHTTCPFVFTVLNGIQFQLWCYEAKRRRAHDTCLFWIPRQCPFSPPLQRLSLKTCRRESWIILHFPRNPFANTDPLRGIFAPISHKTDVYKLIMWLMES